MVTKELVFYVVFLVTTLSLAITPATDIIAQQISENKYILADDVGITAIFHLYEGVEISEFQVFDQIAGFDKPNETPEFRLERIVGETPFLHHAVDQTYRHKGVGSDFDGKFFEVEVIVSQHGKPLRLFEYVRCQVSNYAVDTGVDVAEAWTTPQGFSVRDVFEFICDGYAPSSPAYDDLKSVKNGKTTSSSDITGAMTWRDHPYYKSLPFGG